MTKKRLFANAGKDIPAGLVVFLVALPLCLGISIASGSTPFSGLIAGIVGGLVVGALSNSPLSVSGPAAGLATLVSGAILAIGGIEHFDMFLCAVVIAGLIQISLGALKLGGIANYIPSSVIKGMLTSIGILIIAKQIPHAFGKDRDDKGVITELFEYGNEDWHELLIPLQNIEIGVFLVAILSIIIMVLWDKSSLKKKLPFIPSALVAVVFAVILNQLWISMSSKLQIIESSHLVNLSIAKSPTEFLSFFTFPNFSGFTNSTVIMYGFIIAIIASLETLLSIEAVDNLDPERRVTNTNRELFAQGVGNTISGLIGGLPITSVIVRSSANVNAGAKSKLSTIFHASLLLVSVIAIPFVLNKIPLAALAAILILTGWKLAKPTVFINFWKAGKYQFIPFIVTVVVIIAIDLFKVLPILSGKGLIIGVFAGIIAAIGAILHGNLKNSYYFNKQKHKEGDVIKIKLSEEVSFLNKASIRETLDHMPEMALEILKEGNDRFLKNLKKQRNLLDQVNDTRDSQWPFATILSCIDSRTGAELIFDQGLGDIFSVRIAGNIVNTDIIGSMEFACKIAGSKLIVVLGHTACGAIKGACDHVEMGNLTELLSKIQPAVYQENKTKKDRTSGNAVFVDNVATINVKRAAEQIIERSYILEQLLESGKIGVVGAMYNVQTGKVSFCKDVMYIKDEKNPKFSLDDFRS